MFLPQLQGFSQYIPYLSASALSTNNQIQEGTVLPPGSVTAYNSWDNYNITCPQNNNETSQPLLPLSNNWNTSLSIPATLFMGKPLGQTIEQNYVVGTDGSFSVSDNQGNGYGWSGVQLNLTYSKIATTLFGNSTEAVQNFVVMSGILTVANVSVTYSLRRSFCQPAGLTIAISGQLLLLLNQTASVILSLPFESQPYEVAGSQADFGSNSSGTILGFNWADSNSYSPFFNQTTSTLSWLVGSSFNIDPETIASTNQYMFGIWDHDIWYSEGLWWYFYLWQKPLGHSITDNIEYETSTNGISWSTNQSAFSIADDGYQQQFDIAVSGATIYVVENDAGYEQTFVLKQGTLSQTGTISWGNSLIVTAGCSSCYSLNMSPSVSIDSKANGWIVVPEQSNPPGSIRYACPCFAEVFEYNYTSGSILQDKLFRLTGSNLSPESQLVPLSGGAMSLVACASCDDTGSNSNLSVTDWTGSSWGSTVTLTSGAANNFDYFAANSFGSTTYVALTNQSTGYSSALCVNYTSGNSKGSMIRTIFYTSGDILNPTLTIDKYGNLLANIEDQTKNTITVYKSITGGETWSKFGAAFQSVGASQSGQSLTASLTTVGSGFSGIGWEQGAAAPFNIEFASIPLVIPDPSVFSNAWSRPGLSPYESYFNHLDDYISPGNGLLAIEQQDLYLPGRNGLDLNISRIFQTPYAFGPGNLTVGIDNYSTSYANLGFGWSLNFPWLGQNYVHLQNGEAYPYNWTTSGGSTYFENHAGTNFKLVQNADGSFDLYLVSGEDYHFGANSSGVQYSRLDWIKDATGNNSINFFYSGDHISYITDSINRIVNFTYNGNNQLTSISSGTNMSWSYNYLNGDLVSATDPVGRVTHYTYGAINNYWLMTNITYPTGGQTNFTYGRGQVGTEDYTYYVTLASQYVSADVLDESNQYNYTLTNGLVTACTDNQSQQCNSSLRHLQLHKSSGVAILNP
jgi:YD repeat-containing protein